MQQLNTTAPLAEIHAVRARALRSLIPPPRLKLSEWIERELRLPADVSALPGQVRLWPYQREIADAISDPAIERVTLVKAARLGFTTLLTGALGSFVANEPCPVLVLLPTESDCRDYMVSDVEPIFAASPTLRGLLSGEMRDEDTDRNTLLSRRFPGGSLKIVAARAPRNLRRHTARVLLCDEVDAMELTAEGSPIRLAERRTLTFANRKIVIGSTPVFEDTSHVLASYGQSDMRVYEVPCPECGAFTEIQWAHIEWPPDHPEQAAFRCPHCVALVHERHKASMVAQGRWRATNGTNVPHGTPDAKNHKEFSVDAGTNVPHGTPSHAGFRLSALVSQLANAAWSRLAQEFLDARDKPDDLQVFVNTVLGQGWRAPGLEIDERTIASRAEDFGLNNIPEEVLVITCGVDVGEDRLEASIVGWTRTGAALVLGHVVIWGTPQSDDTVFLELDELLRSRFKHPHGGTLSIDATIVDSGFATDAVYAFCFPRLSRRVWAGKGQAGTHPALRMAKVKTKSAHGGRLFLVGSDTIKSSIFSRLQHGRTIRFSKSVVEAQPSYFEQLVSERQVVRYLKGRPVRRFERKTHRARAECLDTLVYAFAARSGLTIPLDQREDLLRHPDAGGPPPSVIRSRFMERHRGR